MSSLLVGLILAFAYCWQMALVMLCSIPVMIGANVIQMLVLLGASKTDNENLTNAQQIVTDSLKNARTVQALGIETSLVSMYMTWVEKSMTGMYKRNILAGIGFGVASGVMFFIMAGGFYVASILIQEGIADFKGVMMAFMGIFYAGMGAGQAAVMMGDATKAKVACHDMFKLMDRESQIEGLEPKGDSPAKLDAGIIEFKDVKFFYPFRPEIQVLKGINFKISSGQSVGLVGPSGGGKSTVMSLLQRFYDPQEGTVLIGSEKLALHSLNIRWWRKQIGFVGQEPVLFNTTVRANLMYGLDESDTHVNEEYVRKCEKMCNLDSSTRMATRVWRRVSDLVVVDCLVDRSSVWPSAVPCCVIQRSCCWMRPPVHWILKARPSCRRHWKPLFRDVPPLPLHIVSLQSKVVMWSWSMRMVVWWSLALIANSWHWKVYTTNCRCNLRSELAIAEG